MAKFLGGNALNAAMDGLFQQSKKRLIIVSPYIKIHHRYLDLLKLKQDYDALRVIIIFRRDEEEDLRNINKEDLDFLCTLPNIEIRWEKHLHAKYYANDKTAILTSMNLYDYSQNNNIEVGTLIKSSLLSKMKDKLAGDSLNAESHLYFSGVIENSQCIYKREPEYRKTLLGLNKKYLGSKTSADLLPMIRRHSKEIEKKDVNRQTLSIKSTSKRQGYCIRTGTSIPFNPKRPLSESAYRVWIQYEDEYYPENFCHFTGKPSNKENCVAKPILFHHWNEAKTYMEEIGMPIPK